MKKSLKGFLALAIGASFALSACAGSAGDAGGAGGAGKAKTTSAVGWNFNETPYDKVKDGGTITTGITEITENANPFNGDGNTTYGVDLWYWYNPQLALFDGDGTWHFNPDYFDDVTAKEVDGNTVVTYKVKEEAKFNDGTPIDVKAFQTTWRCNNGENKDYYVAGTDGYQNIKSVEPGASDKEVVVTFDGVWAWWQGLFNMVLHPAVDSPKVFNEGFLRKTHPEWGAGPYKIESYDFQKGEAVFVPNELWWGPKGKLDKRIFRQMEDQAALNAFKNGEIDVIGVGNEEFLTAVKEMKDDSIEIRKGSRPASYLLELNSANENLKDVKVRQAVFEGIDRATVAAVRFAGLNFKEDAPGSFLLFASQPGYADNFSKAVKYDPKGAKALLKEAGWEDTNKDGIVEKDGKDLELQYTLVGEAKTSKDIATTIQSQLKAIGIKVNIKERPSAEFSNVIVERDFDLFFLGFNSSDPFGVAYTSQVYGSDSSLNLSGTGTPELDAKIADLAKIADANEQIKAANDVEVEAFKTYGIMPVFNGPDWWAIKKNIANMGSMNFAKPAIESIGLVK